VSSKATTLTSASCPFAFGFRFSFELRFRLGSEGSSCTDGTTGAPFAESSSPASSRQAWMHEEACLGLNRAPPVLLPACGQRPPLHRCTIRALDMGASVLYDDLRMHSCRAQSPAPSIQVGQLSAATS
jgi:hypothetical protein